MHKRRIGIFTATMAAVLLHQNLAFADHGREREFLAGSGEVARAGVYNTISSTYVRGTNYYRNANDGRTRTTEQSLVMNQCNGYGQSCNIFSSARVTKTFGSGSENTLFGGNYGSFGHTYRTCITIKSPSWTLTNQCTALIAHD
jgi:hypothetical protein